MADESHWDQGSQASEISLRSVFREHKPAWQKLDTPERPIGIKPKYSTSKFNVKRSSLAKKSGMLLIYEHLMILT